MRLSALMSGVHEFCMNFDEWCCLFPVRRCSQEAREHEADA
jgi:hypothetical protein